MCVFFQSYYVGNLEETLHLNTYVFFCFLATHLPLISREERNI